jgi:hypothetical protein
MSRYLFFLSFIPVFSFGQSYLDIMSISSLEDFKKVVIENDYQLDHKDESSVRYNYIGNKHDGTIRTGTFNIKDKTWMFSFIRPDFDYQTTPYDLIVEEIKNECKYHKIIPDNNVDFVSYSCNESTYVGSLGFVISNGYGIIKMFPTR